MFKKFVKQAALIGALVFTFNGIASAAVQTADEEIPVKEITKSLKKLKHTVFPIGVPNVNYAKYFTGKSYLYPIEHSDGMSVSNVTFAPSCINNWHIHHGSCQILVGVAGEGWYQIWGEQPQKMIPGVSVTIPEGVKHWHGASQGTWFQHFSIMRDDATTEWLEPVNSFDYSALK